MKRMLLIVIGLLFFGVATAQIISSVDLNTADVNHLLSLKGIGPKKAKAIVTNRKQVGVFHSIDDLMRIKGIGKSFIQRLLKRNPGLISVKK